MHDGRGHQGRQHAGSLQYVLPEQQVIIENKNNKIELVIAKSSAKVNGVDKKITDNVSPMVINSSTYVPIRFVVENMGLDINYDAKDNKIMLNTEKGLIFEEKGKVAKAEEVDDPSVPKDVEKFIVKGSGARRRARPQRLRRSPS